MQRRRGIALAIAIAIALLFVVAGILRWGVSRTRPRSDAISRRASQPTFATAQPLTTATPGVTTAAVSPTSQPAVNLALATAEDLRRAARYPRSSQPLRDGEPDPILRERQVSQNVFPGPNGEAPDLVVFPDQVSFEPPDAVVLHAYLSAGDRYVAANRIDGEVVDSAGQQIAQVEYNDSGRGADGVAGDLVYTADLDTEVSTALPGGAYLVRIRALTAEGDVRTATSGFLYSRPDAQLTGNYGDAIVDGSLEVQAEVQVQAAGRFHLQGTLYTESGTPIAWAQNALSLSPGTHRIPLSFFGLILRERAEDGPYVLRFAALSTTTSMPNALNRLVENAYVTGAYRAAVFSDRPFDDPQLLDNARRLDGSGPLPAAPRN